MRLSFIVCVLLTQALYATVGEVDPRLSDSREIAKRFGGGLKGHLQAAMREGEPVRAIAVCKEIAPAIAEQLSSEYGATVGRTSLRPRNPNNRPDHWQQSVLEVFDRENAMGVSPQQLERLVSTGRGSARYLKAIPVQGLCLSCHGATLAPAVSVALAEHYPDDRATGYQPGELRGAFRIDWPAAQ